MKSWTLTSSKVWAATWDGKVHGKIVPGKYSVKVSIKGPEGHTQTATKTVTVDSGKLKTVTKTITYKASSVLRNVDDDSTDSTGICEPQPSGAVYCSAGPNGGDIALWNYGSITVPSYVLSAQKYGAKAAVYLQGLQGYGNGAWGYDRISLGGAKVGPLTAGTSTLGYLSLPATTKKVYVTVAMGGEPCS